MSVHQVAEGHCKDAGSGEEGRIPDASSGRAYGKRKSSEKAGSHGGMKKAAALREHAAGVVTISLSPGRGMGKGDLIIPCEERFKAALDAASDEWSGSSGRPA